MYFHGKYTSPMDPLGIDSNVFFLPRGWSGGDLRSVLDFMVRVNLDARSHQKPKEFLRREENARGFAGVFFCVLVVYQKTSRPRCFMLPLRSRLNHQTYGDSEMFN